MTPEDTKAIAEGLRKIAGEKVKPPSRLPKDFVAKLKPGDVIVTNAGSKLIYKDKPVAGAVQNVLEKLKSVELGNYGHSLIYAGDGKVIDAHPAYGVREQPIELALAGVHAMALRPKLSRRRRLEAVQRARARVGKTDYSMKEAFRAWGGMHFNMPVRDRRRTITSMMCSGLVNDAYRGKLVNKHPDLTVPPDFAKSKNLQPVSGVGVFKNEVRAKLDQFKMKSERVGEQAAKAALRAHARATATTHATAQGIKSTAQGIKATAQGVRSSARDIHAAMSQPPSIPGRRRGKDKVPRKRRGMGPKLLAPAAVPPAFKPPASTVGGLVPKPM